MPSIILERSVTPRRPNTLGEDRTYVGENYLAVIDGATDKSQIPTPAEEISPGQAIAESLVRVLGHLDPKLDAESAMTTLSRGAIADSRSTANQSASAVIYSVHRSEVWIIGSGSARIKDDVYQKRPKHEQVAAVFRSVWLRTHLQEHPEAVLGPEFDPGREAILPVLRRESLLRNIDQPDPLYFGSLDGGVVPRRHITVLPVEPNTPIVLATDGYPTVSATLAEAEKELAQLLRIDPLCISENIQTKSWGRGLNSFDDRAWLRFTID